MTRPRIPGVRQLSTWVPTHLKDELTARALLEGKPERDVVVAALVHYLKQQPTRPAKPRDN